jgi:hypothetical protein
MFKTEGYEGLGSYAEPIDRMASRSDAVRQVLETAIEKRVITKEGAIYKFHPGELGLDFAAVQMHKLSERAREFIADTVARNR